MAIIACRIVEVCAFRFVNDHPEYLLLKRAPDESIYPGLWQFVTGSINEGERAFDAALRELKEETGLTPLHFWVVPYVISFYDASYDAVNLSPMFAAQVPPAVMPVLSAEHSAFEWLPFAHAQKRLVWPGQRTGLDVVQQYIVEGRQAGRISALPLESGFHQSC